MAATWSQLPVLALLGPGCKCQHCKAALCVPTAVQPTSTLYWNSGLAVWHCHALVLLLLTQTLNIYSQIHKGLTHTMLLSCMGGRMLLTDARKVPLMPRRHPPASWKIAEAKSHQILVHSFQSYRQFSKGYCLEVSQKFSNMFWKRWKRFQIIYKQFSKRLHTTNQQLKGLPISNKAESSEFTNQRLEKKHNGGSGGPRRSGCKTQKKERWVSRTPGQANAWASERLGIRTSECPSVRTSKRPRIGHCCSEIYSIAPPPFVLLSLWLIQVCKVPQPMLPPPFSLSPRMQKLTG